MPLIDLWRGLRDKLVPQKSAPASQLLPRMRESARLRAVARASSSLGEITPFVNETQTESEAAAIAPPSWQDVFPGHHRALVADLAKRGEDMINWEIQDGRDMGVSETGHTVAFRLHKTGTSATIQVELTLFKGQLAQVRVR